jgi:hypothetical protein
MRHFEKGSKNKLDIGDKVQIKRRVVMYNRRELINNYCIPGNKELRDDNINGFHFWLTHYIKGSLPKGRVIGYGADQLNRKGEDSGVLNVAILFRHNGKDLWEYFYERDVVKL